MPDRTDHAAALARSWQANAAPWTRAVREGRIASRAAATDAAVLAAVTARRPSQVLDLGCGEGWLLRRLRAGTECAAVGIDASAILVAAARAADPGGDYRQLAFEEFIAAPEAVGAGFDVAVCNYALFEPDAAGLLAAAASRLTEGGVVVIQTLHPWTAAQGDYRDGWRVEDFAGFGVDGECWVPMPWYFRTLESWHSVIRDAGLSLVELHEPAGTEATPLSLLLIAGRRA